MVTLWCRDSREWISAAKEHTVSVSSHDVEGFQHLRQGRLQLYSDSQVGEGGRGHQGHLNTQGHE